MVKTLRFSFKGPIEGFVINYLKKNEWRLKGVVLKEDVLKDAYQIYSECLDRYGEKVDTPQWFFSLFKRCFINYFHSVSSYATFLYNMESLEDITSEDVDLQSYIGVDNNLGELMIKISRAPIEVRQVIDLVIGENKIFESTWKKQGKKKVDGNEYICKALGYNHKKIDLIAMVYDYFID